MAAAAGVEAEKLCIICEAARFACGATPSRRMLAVHVVEKHAKCPTCGVAFDAQPVSERGDHLRDAPTFVCRHRAACEVQTGQSTDDED